MEHDINHFLGFEIYLKWRFHNSISLLSDKNFIVQCNMLLLRLIIGVSSVN